MAIRRHLGQTNMAPYTGPYFCARYTDRIRRRIVRPGYSTNVHHLYDMNRRRITREKNCSNQLYLSYCSSLESLISEYKHHKLKNSENCALFLSMNRIKIKNKKDITYINFKGTGAPSAP
jgi:hypothetical protein